MAGLEGVTTGISRFGRPTSCGHPVLARQVTPFLNARATRTLFAVSPALLRPVGSSHTNQTGKSWVFYNILM